MLVHTGMAKRTVTLVLLAGLVSGCQYTTTKSSLLATTGDNVGGGSGGSGGGGGSLVAKIDPGCMTNEYDACIFLQNPVAEKGSAFAQPVTRTTDLSAYQTYAVEITGLDNSGLLQNSSYVISPSSVQAVRKDSNGKWKYPYSICSSPGNCAQDGVHKVSQLMAYYWLNYQVQRMGTQTGTFFAAGRGIPVDPFSPGLANAYWDYTTRSIVLGEINSQDLAISAEVYLHENGHANVHYAGMGNIEAPGLDIACDPNMTSRCCPTNKGCPGGINEGLADFHAGILFPNDTALGEAIVNSPGGFIECGLPREISLNANLTAAAAYNACPASVRGEIHVVGRVYASVWWEVRKAAANPQEIETLFTEHLRVLDRNDTFETAAGKINTLDNTLFGGRHVAAFNAQWAGRGLTPR